MTAYCLTLLLLPCLKTLFIGQIGIQGPSKRETNMMDQTGWCWWTRHINHMTSTCIIHTGSQLVSGWPRSLTSCFGFMCMTSLFLSSSTSWFVKAMVLPVSVSYRTCAGSWGYGNTCRVYSPPRKAAYNTFLTLTLFLKITLVFW